LKETLLSKKVEHNTKNSRLLTIDLVRWISFWAIVAFHTSYALWSPYGLIEVPYRGIFSTPVEVFARLLSFSGFTVLFLSFFLFGLNGSRKFGVLPKVLLGFGVLWIVLVQEFPYWWDVYPFLLCVFMLLGLRKRYGISDSKLALGSFVLLCIPFWKLDFLFPVWLATPLVGACSSRADLGDWALLPWAFYPTFAYAVGGLAARSRARLRTMAKAETLVWVCALTGSLFFIGGYYHTPIGEAFGCSVFRKPPLEFWAHQVWIFALVRIAFLPGVHTWLLQRNWMGWVSASVVNRRFFIVYCLHYPLVFAIAGLARKVGWDHRNWILGAAFAAAMILIEGLPRLSESVRLYLSASELKWLRTSAKS